MENKSKAELIQELLELRSRVAELERLRDTSLQILNELSGEAARPEVEQGWRHLLQSALMATTDDCFTISDFRQSDNPLVYVNPGFEKVSGYSAEEVLGRNCRFLQGEDRDQPALDTLRQALIEGRKCQVLLRNYRKDGTLFWNELNLYPLYDHEGYVTHFVGVQHDVTKRESLKEMQAKLIEVMESGDEARKDAIFNQFLEMVEKLSAL